MSNDARFSLSECQKGSHGFGVPENGEGRHRFGAHYSQTIDISLFCMRV